MTNEELNEACAKKLGVKLYYPSGDHSNCRKVECPCHYEKAIDYVGSIIAAWEIVEKNQMTLTHERIVPSDREAFWRYRATIQIGPNHLEGSFISECAELPGEAIVRAFLKL